MPVVGVAAWFVPGRIMPRPPNPPRAAPMTSSGSGSVIWQTVALQPDSDLTAAFSFWRSHRPGGSDAAQFITAVRGPRCMACRRSGWCWAANRTQPGSGPAGARAYRRTDGQWEARCWSSPRAPLDVALKARGWSATAGNADFSMCVNGWTYPPLADTRRGEEGYFCWPAGLDLCSAPNANYRTSPRARGRVKQAGGP